VNNHSFHESTNRGRIDKKAVASAQRLYTFNYLKLLPKSRNSKIIDLGCSEGISLGWLLDNGYQNLVGVDSDSVAIELTKKKYHHQLNIDSIIAIDALSYLKSCDNDSVDMVIMLNVIEHIPKDIILEIMIEIRRILKKGGSFLAQTGNWENPFNIGLFTRDFTHQVMYTRNSLRQLMVIAGFLQAEIKSSPVKYKTTWRNFPLQLLQPFFGWLVKGISACMRMHIRETSPLIYCHVKKDV